MGEFIKEWSGLTTLVAVTIWGIVELFLKFYKQKEEVRQNQQHTEQERLTTDEKALDLDSRRVKASEEVASEALESLAETREENLDLLESKYNLRKEIIKLKNRVDNLEKAQEFTNKYVCFEENCSKRRPPLGTYKPKCLSDGAEIQA